MKKISIDSNKSPNFIGSWNIENDKRLAEKNKTFDKKFIELARNVYKSNDQRAKVKLEINNVIGIRTKITYLGNIIGLKK